MARLGRKDRGLLAKIREGKQVWFVRLYPWPRKPIRELPHEDRST